MPVFTLGFALFCLPVVQTDTDVVAQQTKPPRAKSNQYCIHLSIPDGSGGWKWDLDEKHCEDTVGQLCGHICKNYTTAHGYTKINCGTEPTADKQYTIVPPYHTPNDKPTIQHVCICAPQPIPTPIRSVQTCYDRPRLFARLRCR